MVNQSIEGVVDKWRRWKKEKGRQRDREKERKDSWREEKRKEEWERVTEKYRTRTIGYWIGIEQFFCSATLLKHLLALLKSKSVCERREEARESTLIYMTYPFFSWKPLGNPSNLSGAFLFLMKWKLFGNLFGWVYSLSSPQYESGCVEDICT